MPNYNASHNDLSIQLETKQNQLANIPRNCSMFGCNECQAQTDRLNAEISFIEYRINTLANASDNSVETMTNAYRIANATIANARSTQEQRAMEFTAQTIADRINALATRQGAGSDEAAEKIEAVAGPKSPAAQPQDNQTNQERADTMKQDTRTTTERFIDAVNAMPEQAVRRWSFEIEAVSLGGAVEELECLGMNTHYDTSVSFDGDCVCSCGTCDHSCDCDNCSISQGYDEQCCGNCSHTEASPSDYQRITSSTWNGKIEEACNAIESVGGYINTTCGGHVHVNADDITIRGAVNVMRLWLKVVELMPEFIGRGFHEDYARRITPDIIMEVSENHRRAERMSAINITNVSNTLEGYAHRDSKQTVEFRQFAGTLDPRQIIARGYLCRAIYELANGNSAIYWALNATTPAQLLRELGLPTT